VIGGLQVLVKQDGLTDLRPHLDAVLHILVDAFNHH